MHHEESHIFHAIEELKTKFHGDIFTDESHRVIYSTDASVYAEKPVAVARPKNTDDIKLLIKFASENSIGLIPRTAGTSLAGQVVGNGIIADVSKYFTEILEINKEEHWVRVQPGVVTDELNKFLEPYGLLFGPETSTSNRCMIGGMVGNNSCGAHSLIYGSTRDHTLEINAILSDGSEVVFKAIDRDEFEKKCIGNSLENRIYQQIKNILSDEDTQKEIVAQFPDKKLKRRNNGYAIDILADTQIFSKHKEKFNFCKLIAGSEGTLAFITEIKLNLVPQPPKFTGLVCAHFKSLSEAFLGNLVALEHKPDAIELMDDVIIEAAKSNIEQSKNSFFVKGKPKAVLAIEFTAHTQEDLKEKALELEADFHTAGIGYSFPLITGNDIKKVWNLRKAGLGLLSNIPGDKKPVTVIEDTAVLPEFLPDYIAEFEQMLAAHKLQCVYYAHIATGEIHLKPELNLKDEKDVKLFKTLALETAKLVKKYKGSLSGEHGDGRLRGEFIKLMLGEKIYSVFLEIKNVWDPKNIFNPGKIVNTPPMNSGLRYKPGRKTKEIKTYFNFSETLGIVRATENCSGSADCRKSELIGGIMCPSYMATKNEQNTTRARANLLRHYLTTSIRSNPFNHAELFDILDECISCKGCKSECPSSVDMAKLKSEFLQHWYDANGTPMKAKLVAGISSINKKAEFVSSIYNYFLRNRFTSSLIKKQLGFTDKRALPEISKTSLRTWFRKKQKSNTDYGIRKILFFADEFSNHYDTHIGIKAIQTLEALGYNVDLAPVFESGRTYISKGLLKKAAKIAKQNILSLSGYLANDFVLIGIEPSAVLTFRDEYLNLLNSSEKELAVKISERTFLFDEFISSETEKGIITKDLFTKNALRIKLHGHCHQKSIASTTSIVKMLTLPENYHVEEIKSGCCGMAGSFGYEKNHYELSMKIGELVLFPEIRKSQTETIAAPGASCRQQILDGTGLHVLHPVEILHNALEQKN